MQFAVAALFSNVRNYGKIRTMQIASAIKGGVSKAMKTYKTQGTCSRAIEYDVENGVLTACRFIGGCPGNTQGVARLAVGRKVEDVVALLKGIQCRNGTSCPDQLARALETEIV